jgi:hypothetical protein
VVACSGKALALLEFRSLKTKEEGKVVALELRRAEY